MATDRTLRCVVTAPQAKKLDCRTASVVLPAHDGQVGILYNHMPMFCKLGLGIMKVGGLAPEGELPPADTFLLIDGGFALISSNVVSLVTYDAISVEDLQKERPEKVLKDILARPVSPEAAAERRVHDKKKDLLVKQLAQIADTPKETPSSSE